MYHVNVQKTFDGRTEETEKSFKSSIDAGNYVRDVIGQMITAWMGQWELDFRQVGHPEANHCEYHGSRFEAVDSGDNTEVSFEISSWG